MKKDKAAKSEVKSNVNPQEVSHFKSGHKWLAWITGLTAAWVAFTFISGLCNPADLPVGKCYLNVWYIVNLAVIAVLCCMSTFAILKKCPWQIFMAGSSMFLLLLQSVSLLFLFFYQQDTAAINAIAMFAWSACWYGYMVTSPAVESDVPAAYRKHGKIGEAIVAVMTLSTVAFGIMMAINLLW